MSNIQRCFTGEGARGLDFISPRWHFWKCKFWPKFSPENLLKVFPHWKQTIFIQLILASGAGLCLLLSAHWAAIFSTAHWASDFLHLGSRKNAWSLMHRLAQEWAQECSWSSTTFLRYIHICARQTPFGHDFNDFTEPAVNGCVRDRGFHHNEQSYQYLYLV